MNPAVPTTLFGAVGPAGFAVLVWGSILSVVGVFGYIVWTVASDR